MSYRAFRENREHIRGKFSGLTDEITYRIPGVSIDFMTRPDELCQDCSMPMITMQDKESGKAIRVWHDETCVTAPEDAKVKPRVLDRQR